jgi:protein-S-isoprenylcysteine O-methyltransferase Ste14
MDDGMQLVIAQLVGVVVFFVGVLILGLWLRRLPTAGAARGMSFASHVLFHTGLSVPMVWGLFWPGAGRFDAIVGLPPLPVPIAWRFLGVGLLTVGVYFVALSNVALAKWGRGMASFVLSKQVVEVSLYERTRNPLALGWYLMCLGVACYARSTYLTLYLLLGHIPAHLFYLKFFEERELALRFGEKYAAYRQRVPFLVPRRRFAPEAT